VRKTNSDAKFGAGAQNYPVTRNLGHKVEYLEKYVFFQKKQDVTTTTITIFKYRNSILAVTT
jgi:hypothetical protein